MTEVTSLEIASVGGETEIKKRQLAASLWGEGEESTSGRNRWEVTVDKAGERN